MTDKQPAGNTELLELKNGSLDANLPDAVLALTIAYDGSHFSGFARQDLPRTVQGELEKTLCSVFHREVLTTGAGRTDAGVHALGNVVSFGVSCDELEERSLDKLQNTLNALTPSEIVIKKVEQKPADFSARFSAKSREYRYRILPGKTPPLFLEPYVWWIKNPDLLNISGMKEAAAYFEGEHDFRSFCVAKSADLGPTTRYISKVMIFGTQHLGEQCMVIQIIGNAFLHSMVRVMVGTLVEVGLRKQSPEWIVEVLKAKDRRAAGQTAPAQGLTLWRVRY